jgi:hypothetical protein
MLAPHCHCEQVTCLPCEAVQIRGTVSCVLYDQGSLKFVTGLHVRVYSTDQSQRHTGELVCEFRCYVLKLLTGG